MKMPDSFHFPHCASVFSSAKCRGCIVDFYHYQYYYYYYCHAYQHANDEVETQHV